MPESGTLYVYAKGSSNKNVAVVYDGAAREFNIDNPCIIAAGYYKKGENVIVSYPVDKDESGEYHIYAAMLDYDAFYAAYDRLSQNAMNIYKFSDTDIRGSITADKDGVLYTSVPYDKGWKLYIDGKPTGTKPFQNAFVSAEITKGRHEVRFEYIPAGYREGLILSFICFIIIAVLFKFYKSPPGKIFDSAACGLSSAYREFGEDGWESGE